MKRCVTKYPVLLLHGLNCRDEKPFYYFGRIPAYLGGRGVKVYLGGQDASGTIESNARQIQKRLEGILEWEGCEKVNIIAHSKGGLEARYLISTLGMASSVASLTTLSTPHRGSRTAKKWCMRKLFLRIYSLVSNKVWRLMGDRNPDFHKVLRELTPAYLKSFNRRNPDSPLVFYQSYGARMNQSRDDRFMAVFRKLIFTMDGENDGLVAPESARWGLYRGTLENISHLDLVDTRQADVKSFPVTKFYSRLIRDLAERGF